MSENDLMISRMIEKAREVMAHAYSPYSKFKVGCCIRTEDDQLFSGCNVENVSYSLTICAEANALGVMVASGEHHIRDVVVVCSADATCPPCGACRQSMIEFSSPETRVHLIGADKNIRTYRLIDLLPLSFHQDLLPGDA